MNLPSTLSSILDRALDHRGPSRQECAYLLDLASDSLEAACLRAVADQCSRRRFHHEGIILGQVGVETFPCPANCRFCVFGRGHTTFPPRRLSQDEVLFHARAFNADDDLYAFFIMLMHEYDFEDLLKTVETVRGAIPAHTQIVVNIGDFDRRQADELKAAGVGGAYHVLRLREGIDTDLNPDDRKRTIRAIRDAGLRWYYCCEPIGPEHTPDELAEQIFLGVEYGCFQHAAMRRVSLPNSPLAHYGQISELRLAQVVAVVALATLSCPETRNIAVHEPNLIGLTSGANVVYAESGANPRDAAEETSYGRGLDVAACKKMLYEAGFHALQVGGTDVKPVHALHL